MPVEIEFQFQLLMIFRHRFFRAVRKLHIVIGLVSALYFMLIAATGVAINHRSGWRLDERYVSRTWLPGNYRADESEVRMDIAVGDLHSGLIFGKYGAPTMDFVAAVWFISILSGLTMLALRRSIHSGARRARKRYVSAPPVKPVSSAKQDEPERVATLR
jgi:uncharacterized iron-regulated membrane protein